MANKLLHFNDDCPVCFGDGWFDAGDDAWGNSTNIDCPACKANQELATLRFERERLLADKVDLNLRLAEAEKLLGIAVNGEGWNSDYLDRLNDWLKGR